MTAGGNLLVNGDFENEPNWGGGVYYAPGSVTALVGNQIPGWTIEPNHALTIHLATGIDPTISGNYSANPDGEGYQGNNANFYQDFDNNANVTYTLSFNWQSWGQSLAIPTTSQQQVSVEDTVTGSVLFNGLYAYDGNNPHPVHSVTASFLGTGNGRTRMNNASAFNAPLHQLDSETQTCGCRHNHPDFCAKNRLPKVCAFVRQDKICFAPPSSWPKQFRKLQAAQSTGQK